MEMGQCFLSRTEVASIPGFITVPTFIDQLIPIPQMLQPQHTPHARRDAGFTTIPWSPCASAPGVHLLSSQRYA